MSTEPTSALISHIKLTLNHLVRELIAQRCKDHGAEVSIPTQDINDGESGALKNLIDLLEQGFELAMQDVTSTNFNLCKRRGNRGKAVRDRVVRVILDKITDSCLRIVGYPCAFVNPSNAIDELEKLESVGCLLSIQRESTSEFDGINCIVILHDISGYSGFPLKEVQDDDKDNGTISKLAENGTSRAKRKANSIPDKLRSSRRIIYTHTA